jgi:surface antigen
MLQTVTRIIALAVLASAVPATADSASYNSSRSAGVSRELPPYLQCVPYAREQSGVQIYGDAHTWWGQAKGKFARGKRPKVGAVMAFQPHRNMKLGHVAAVSKIVDSRTILLRHSNWSPINGRRGQIENDVKAIDVSPNNDWSSVRVWYDPIQALGKTAWPIHGFIYSDKAPRFSKPQAPAARIARVAPAKTVISAKPSKAFSNAFGNLGALPAIHKPAVQKPAARKIVAQPKAAPQRRAIQPASRVSANRQVASALSLYD